MPAGFLESIVPKQITLLGQKLLPYSLGHNILLNFFQNAFLTAGKIGLEDLLEGIFICCQTWEENQASMGGGKVPELMKNWGEQIGCFDFKEKAQIFNEYLFLGNGLPEVLPPEGEEARAMGSPFDLRLLIFLIKELRLTHGAALNFPYGLARHLFFGYHEAEGRARVANPEELEQMRQLEEEGSDEEILKKCMDALPGSVPLEQRDAGKKQKRKKQKGVKRAV